MELVVLARKTHSRSRAANELVSKLVVCGRKTR